MTEMQNQLAMLPVKATPAMIEAACELDWGPGGFEGDDATPDKVWSAMVQAHLKEREQE